MASNLSLEHLLATNEPPLAILVTHIQNLAVELSDELSYLDSEIEDMEKKLSVLSRRRDERCARKKSFLGILSPLRRIPPELIAEMMYSFVFGPSGDFSNIIVLGHICRSWRRILYSTPKLWTSLNMNPLLSASKDVFSSWLGMSGGLPVSLNISDNNAFLTPSIIYVIKANRQRIRALKLSLYMENEVELLFEKSDEGGSWDRLEQFSLHLETEWPTRLSITSAPRLHEIELWGDDLLEIDVTTISLPWSQLTQLSLNLGSTPEDNLQILERCPALMMCSIQVRSEHVWAPDDPPPKTVRLPNLTSLEIRFNGDTSRILDFLELPSLRSLALFSQFDLPVPAEPLMSLVRRLTDLKKFILDKVTLPSYELVSIFGWMHGLQDLEIRGGSKSVFDDFLLRSMIRVAGHLPCLPCLEVLTIDVPPAFTPLYLYQFALSRRAKDSASQSELDVKLRRLCVLRNCEEYGPAVMLRLLALDGLDLEYKEPNDI